MQITINGRKTDIAGAVDIAMLLEREGFAGKKVAVARNGAFVSRGSYAMTQVVEGDTFDIVAPMQGG